MSEKIEGIILRRVPYLSKGVILDVLTPHGKIPLILPGRTKGGKSETQPGNLAFLVIGRPRAGAMPCVREIVPNTPSIDISRLSPFRAAQLLLICELTAHTVRGSESGPELYELLYQTVRSLDAAETERYICLRYAYQLARLLGFAPGSAADDLLSGKYFDLQAGEFSPDKPLHNYYLTPVHTAAFFALGDPDRPVRPASGRDYRNLWHILMTYFSLHIDGFRPPRSLDFLQELTFLEFFRENE